MKNKTLPLATKIRLILLVAGFFGIVLFANWIIVFSNQFSALLNK